MASSLGNTDLNDLRRESEVISANLADSASIETLVFKQYILLLDAACISPLIPGRFPKPTVVRSDNYTYTLFHEPSSYWTARQRCVDRGEILATIPTEQEQRFLEMNFDAAPQRRNRGWLKSIEAC